MIQRAIALALPVLSCWHMATLPDGFVYEMTMFGYEMMPVRIASLSLVWGYVFHIAAFLSVIYALHVKDTLQHVSSVMYAGAAIGAAFAGDLITLFIFWELTAITSVFLIWANRTPTSAKVGTRYLVIQVGSGVILLFGVMLWANDTGSVLFTAFQPAADDQATHRDVRRPGDQWSQFLGGLARLTGLWHQGGLPLPSQLAAGQLPQRDGDRDGLPQRLHHQAGHLRPRAGFAGTDMLIYVGAVCDVFPIFFAVIENDLRKVLAYSLNNQLGYMVVGIGIGTQLALNGTASHAFAHIIYKGLLFMAMGACFFGLAPSRPTDSVGSTSPCLDHHLLHHRLLSISGFPLFSGFVTKSMTLSAAFHLDTGWLFVALLIASAGVVDHSGIKIPFFAFFARQRVEGGPRAQEHATRHGARRGHLYRVGCLS